MKNNTIKRKYVLYIFIVILIAATVTLALRIGNDVKMKKEAERKEEEAIKEEIRKQKEKIEKEQEELKEETEKKSFNYKYESSAGTSSKASVSWTLDDVMTNNKTSNKHLIEVFYNDTSYGTSSQEIVKVKALLKDFEGFDLVNYEVSFEYGADGYINKMIIKEQ